MTQEPIKLAVKKYLTDSTYRKIMSFCVQYPSPEKGYFRRNAEGQKVFLVKPECLDEMQKILNNSKQSVKPSQQQPAKLKEAMNPTPVSSNLDISSEGITMNIKKDKAHLEMAKRFIDLYLKELR